MFHLLLPRRKVQLLEKGTMTTVPLTTNRILIMKNSTLNEGTKGLVFPFSDCEQIPFIFVKEQSNFYRYCFINMLRLAPMLKMKPYITDPNLVVSDIRDFTYS